MFGVFVLLSLSLLMLRVAFAHHKEPPFPADDFALCAAYFYRSVYFHCGSFHSQNDPALRSIIRGHFHPHAVALEDLDIMDAHLTRQVAQNHLAALQLNAKEGIRQRFRHHPLFKCLILLHFKSIPNSSRKGHSASTVCRSPSRSPLTRCGAGKHTLARRREPSVFSAGWPSPRLPSSSLRVFATRASTVRVRAGRFAYGCRYQKINQKGMSFGCSSLRYFFIKNLPFSVMAI